MPDKGAGIFPSGEIGRQVMAANRFTCDLADLWPYFVIDERWSLGQWLSTWRPRSASEP